MKVVEKSNDSEPIWRDDALRKVLKEIHSLFVMFHGSIRAMLEKEPGGGLIRRHLHSFIMDYLRGKWPLKLINYSFSTDLSFKIFHCKS